MLIKDKSFGKGVVWSNNGDKTGKDLQGDWKGIQSKAVHKTTFLKIFAGLGSYFIAVVFSVVSLDFFAECGVFFGFSNICVTVILDDACIVYLLAD